MNRGKVLIAAPVHDVLRVGLQEAGYELTEHLSISQEEALALIADYVGVVTSTRLHLDSEFLQAAAHLRWIGRMGSGMEIIDLDYARAAGISCFSSPEGNCNAVAEHALGMLLSVSKRISWSHQEVSQGKWLRDENRGTELEGKTIGIIGFGHTGRAFARKLQGMDMHILAYDKYQRYHFPEFVTPCESLEPIFAAADIVSFHVPMQPDTMHYFDAAFLDALAKPCIVINTSRGLVVHTKTLLEALEQGRVAGACLDVFDGEPLSRMNNEQIDMLNRLMKMPQVIITPHIAGYSVEALYKMSSALLQKIVIAE